MLSIMMMNGLLSVADAMFLGHFAGTQAMAAVGTAFPVVMATIALASLVGGGMASLLARQLGAGAEADAMATFAGAHGLALTIAAVLIWIFLIGGWDFARFAAGSGEGLAEMVWTFLAVTVLGTPVQFLVGLHVDAWRSEGRAGMMAALSVGVTVVNLALNFVFVGVLGLGVAGSALATVLAQSAALVLLVERRLVLRARLRLSSLHEKSWRAGWGRIIALGLPVSLGFVGMMLSASIVVLSLQTGDRADGGMTLAAYGIVTRLFGFAFLPALALAMAMQSIVGNNIGAGLHDRSKQGLRIAILVAFLYGCGMELLFLTRGDVIGAAFISDPVMIAEVGRLLQPMSAAYLLSGPVLVFGFYFQATGQPVHAALLTTAKPLVLLPILILIFRTQWGREALWLAYPVADLLAAAIALILLLATLKLRAPTAELGLRP
ncbi:MATE family efflux transporter [Xaviernesmea oryzae]|nr:MATE family efflux transporter [Xaviernesmea oryzae]